MRVKSKLKLRLIVDLLMVLVGGLILGGILYYAETRITLNRQADNISIKLDMVEAKLKNYQVEADEELGIYDHFSQAKADILAYYYQCNPERKSNLTDLNSMANQWQVQDLCIIHNRQIVYCSKKTRKSRILNNKVLDLLKQDNQAMVSDIRYYWSQLKDGDYVLIGRKSNDFYRDYRSLTSLSYALKTIKIGTTGYILGVSLQNGSLVYGGPDAEENTIFATAGISSAYLKNGHRGWVKYQGKRYYAETRVVDQQYACIALASGEEIQNEFMKVFKVSLVTYFLLMCFLVLYIYYIRIDHLIKVEDITEEDLAYNGKNYQIRNGIWLKMLNLMLLGLTLTFVTSFYCQTLTLLSSQELRSEVKIADIEKILDENDKTYDSLKTKYNAEYSRRMQNIAVLIQMDPAMLQRNRLSQLAKRGQIQSLYIFDEEGKVVATNTANSDFVLSTDAEDQSFEFWDIINGYATNIVQEAKPEDANSSSLIQYTATKRLDAPGMVEGGMLPQRLENRVKRTKIDYVLSNVAVENGGIAFAVDQESHKLLYYPKSKYIGRGFGAIGLSDTALTDDYSGYQTLSSTSYFTSCVQHGSYFVYVAAPQNIIMTGRVLMTVIVTLASGLIFLVFSVLTLLEKKSTVALEVEEMQATHGEGTSEESASHVKIHSILGQNRNVQTAASRWENHKSIAWGQRTPEQKMKAIAFYSTLVLCVFFLFYVYEEQNRYNANDILSYIIHRKWEKTPSLFSFTYIGIIVMETLVFTWLIRKIIALIAASMGAKVETIARLVNSFIKYFGIMGMVLYSLNFLGINSSAVLASAGILTLVVGLGAQKLIEDILAGIFIVFEGEFRVGDIITIGDWRGTVLEIGIRSTKIEDISQNIKILNNSAISGVVNMTKQYSYAGIEVGIEYGESLERVESILQTELPLLKERIPEIENGPFYLGVVALADSSVNIKISAECQEVNRVALTRILNREIKLILDRHGINIPFPQVVVNHPLSFQQATEQERAEAEQFFQEQKGKAHEYDDEEEN